MPTDENMKRNIRDLYFDQHKTIRELAKITRKSSRDIVVLLRNSEHKKKAEENKTVPKNNTSVSIQGIWDTEHDLPPNIKPYSTASLTIQHRILEAKTNGPSFYDISGSKEQFRILSKVI
jgi:hypothetical protein